MCPHSDFDEMESVNNVPSISENVENERSESKTIVPFEYAMTMTGFGKFNILSGLFVGFLMLGMILETLGFSYVIPVCQCDLELTLTQKGWLAAIPFIGIIITSHAWGYLADTRGRKKMLVFSMGFGSFCSILSSFAPDLITFAGLRFIVSLFISAASSLGYAYIGELSPLNQRDIMLTLTNAFVAVGTAVVPLIAWGVLPLDFKISISFLPYIYRPWRLLVALFALPFAICAFLFMYFPESPKYLMNKGKSMEALKILKHIYSVNSGKSPEEFSVKKIEEEIGFQNNSANSSFLTKIWNQTSPLFKAPYIQYTMLACFLQFATFAVTNGFYIWFPDVLNKILNEGMAGDSQNICGILSSKEPLNDSSNFVPSTISICDDSLNTNTFPISILLSTFVTIVTVGTAFLLKTVGKRNVLIIIFILNGTCGLVIHWITNTIISITLFFGLQLAGTCIGIINAYVVEIFPTNVRAMAVCLTLMIGRVGSVFGTNIIGYLISVMCPASFFFFSGLLYLSAVLCLAFPSRKVNAFKTSDESLKENT
ncbi:putative niacin/nicotinamide transporter NiaP [Arctopsyche grandis]|uniref:putative niacin/nicotinamide transporter NiaP n=1 Tax=Arctopsyche grandis TaxID=121162 RepID=UPI00406D96DD